MDLRDYLENKLTKIGFTDIKWFMGRKGLYLTGQRNNHIEYIDLAELVNEILIVERIPYYFVDYGLTIKE